LVRDWLFKLAWPFQFDNERSRAVRRSWLDESSVRRASQSECVDPLEVSASISLSLLEEEAARAEPPLARARPGSGSGRRAARRAWRCGDFNVLVS
jgi:hypothetical protein